MSCVVVYSYLLIRISVISHYLSYITVLRFLLFCFFSFPHNLPFCCAHLFLPFSCPATKLKVDIVVRQLSTLQTQLDTKKRDFYEYVAKELQELQDCGKLDEVVACFIFLLI